MRYKNVLLICFFWIGMTDGQTQDEADPAKIDSNATGGIIIVSTAVFIAVIGMSLFGHRMKKSGIKWFTINVCAWGLVHMLYLSAYYDKSPWPEWFKSQMWTDKSATIATLMRCVFPVGAIGIMIEQTILTINPRLQDKTIWQNFTAAAFLLGHNLLIALVFAFEYSSKECASDKQALKNLWCYWYSPTEMLGLWSYGLFIAFTEIFLVLSIVGCCFCCWAMFVDPQGQRAPRTFNHPWLTLIWAHIPMVMYGPSFGMSTLSFVMTKLMDWIIEKGLISLVIGGGLGSGPSFLPSWFPKIDFGVISSMGAKFMMAMPWFITLFPLIEVVLTLFCFEMYREQMFHAISCGRLFHEKPKTVKERVKERMYFATTRPLKLIPVHSPNLLIFGQKPNPQLQPLLQQGFPIQGVQVSTSSAQGPGQSQAAPPGVVTTQPVPVAAIPPLANARPGQYSALVPNNHNLTTFAPPGVQTSSVISNSSGSGYSQVSQAQVSPIYPLLSNNQNVEAGSPRRKEQSDPLVLQDIISNVTTQV